MNGYVVLVSFAVLPLGVWLFARSFMARQTGLVTGAAFGLVIPLLSELTLWFFGEGEFFPELSYVGALFVLFHTKPAYFLIHLFEIHIPYWLQGYYFYLPLGVFWAAIYGYIGLRVDRARLARSRSPRRAQ